MGWAYQCNNPTTCAASNLLSLNGGTATTVAGNPNAAVSNYTSVPMTFDGNGSAPFSFTYNDAGQITLYAQKTLTASSTVAAATLSGSSNAFVSKPAGFTVTNIQQTASPQLANPAASSAADSKFVKAGESFSATITATTSTGAATPNFGKETSPEGVLLSPALVLPSTANGGVAGSVSINNVASAPIPGGSFSSGIATITNLAWSEVGILKLTPSVADGNYLGAGSVTGDRTGSSSANIGRFYPDHFSVVSGSFATDSTTRGYTYMGQPFGINLVLEARSTSDVKTTNYSTTGGFAKLDPTAVAGWPSTALGTTPATGSWGLGARGTPGLTGATALDVSSRLALSGTPTGSWVAGSTTVAANLTFSRPTTTTTWGPFENTLFVGLYPKDADGVSLLGSALNLDADANGSSERIRIGTSSTLPLGTSTTIRLGRLLLFNSYGSELLNPRVEMRAQAYGASGGWITHTADSHTALASSNVATSNVLGALTAPLAVASVSSPLVSGVGTIVFTKPSPAKTGSFDMALNLGASGVDTSCNASHGGTAANLVWLKDFGYTNCSSGATTWLRDPNARITLGSPKQPYLYLRERY